MSRILRPTLIAITATLVGFAILAQWIAITVNVRRLCIATYPSELELFIRPTNATVQVTLQHAENYRNGYFALPSAGRVHFGTISYLLVPWWFLFAAWLPMTLLVWRFTRRRSEGGFPIEAISAKH